MALALSEMMLHWSLAPSSMFTKKSRQAGAQLKDGDIPDETVIVTGPVQTGGASPGLVPSEEHASKIALTKGRDLNVRIDDLLEGPVRATEP
jgi:hypothetical protein